MKSYNRLTTIFLCWLLINCVFPFSGLAKSTSPQSDSLFLIAQTDYQLYLQHKVGPAETMQSLANLYSMSLKEIQTVNWQQGDKPLKIGQTLRIPLDTACIIRNPIKINEFPYSSAIYYTVQPGETLYRISKTRLGINPQDLIAWNELPDAVLSPGQKLLIGWFSIDYFKKYRKELIQKEFTIINKYMVETYKNQKAKGNEKVSSGAAQKIEGVKSNSSVVMHRDATIGSIISIINPMTKHVAFAKVVGRVPASYAPSVQVLIPVSLAEQLGALDDKFFVRTRYF